MKNHWFIVIIVLAILFSCKKDKTTQDNCDCGAGDVCEPIEDIKRYFDFKIGSWWVYEEETSGIRDSVYVFQQWDNSNTYEFDVRTYSVHYDYQYHYWPESAQSSPGDCPNQGAICKRCLKVKRSIFIPSVLVHEAPCFIFIPSVGEYDYAFNSTFSENLITIDSLMDSYTIGSTTFGQTVRIHELKNYVEGNQSTNHYFSQDVGLIRKELLDSNEVWNLVNYYIQQ